jgi:hypothetical protein
MVLVLFLFVINHLGYIQPAKRLADFQSLMPTTIIGIQYLIVSSYYDLSNKVLQKY